MEDSTATIAVPVLPWMRSPINIDEFGERPVHLVTFLDPRLKKALKKIGIRSLFPVQVALWWETIGPGLFERDICVNSPTGSGKTLAYALPIVQALSRRSTGSIRFLRALVVLPTRDLALQVRDVFASIACAVDLRVGLAVGQSSIAEEVSELIKMPNPNRGLIYDPYDVQPEELQSSVDILVATPGRLVDHIENTKGFTLKHLCYLVVDETDRLLREAYQSWLPTVLQRACSNDEQVIGHAENELFMLGPLATIKRLGVERGFKDKTYPRLVKMVVSATLTQDPSKLSQLDLHHPLFLTSGKRRYKLPEKLESYKLICDSKLKPLYLLSLLKESIGEKCIVFTSSVEATHRLSTLLNFFGDLPFKISEYSGLQQQAVRSKALKAFREGEIEVLVSSDAMTRGMDVEGVKNIINYDMPPYIKTYIHRAGRTARAGQRGCCFTLLRKDEVKKFKKMLQKAGISSCSEHSVSTESIESLRPIYSSALEMLKESVQSEAERRPNVWHNTASSSKGRKRHREDGE